jgi:protein arginine kinase
MELTDLFIGPVPWAAKQVKPGNPGNMVVCSVFSCFRNLNALPFLPVMSPEHRVETGHKILAFLQKKKPEACIQQQLTGLQPGEAYMLCERFLLPASFANDSQPVESGHDLSGAQIVIYSEGRWSALVNLGEHLVLNRFEPGHQAGQTGQSIIVEMLETIAWEKWAVTQKAGYLTSDPARAGSGFRVAMLVHFPGTFLIRQQDKLQNALRASGFSVQGHGRLSGFGGLFWIVSRGSLGKSEIEVMEAFSANLNPFLKMETSIQEGLLQKDRTRLEDKIYRALSLLKNARMLSYSELLELGSLVQLGVYLGLMQKGILEVMSLLMVKSAEGHIQLGESERLSPAARDAMRATMVRLSLKGFGQ